MRKARTSLNRLRTSLFIITAFALSANAQEIKPVDENQSAFSFTKSSVKTGIYGGLVTGNNERGLDPHLQKFRAHNQSETGQPNEPIQYSEGVLKNIGASFKKEAPNPRVLGTFLGNRWSGTPPDNAIAVSNDGIILCATNIDMYYYDETGTQLGFSTFARLSRLAFPKLNDILYDPKVVYDEEADRFILVFLHGSTPGNSHILAFFSKTNNPFDGWHAYQINGGEVDENAWLDFPNIGINKNELFITGNLFDVSNKSTESVIYQINKWDCYKGGELRFVTYNGMTDRSGSNAFTIVPVERGRGTSNQNFMHFVSTGNWRGNFVQFFTIDGELDNENTTLRNRFIQVESYASSNSARQKDSNDELDGSDCRVRKAISINDNAFVVHHTISSRGQVAIMLHKFPMSDFRNAETIVIEDGNFAAAYPSIAAAGTDWDDETVVICYLKGGSTMYPGFNAVAVDNNFDVSSTMIIKDGEGFINIDPNSIEERWGDYSSIARKYNSNTVWAFGCIGNADNNFDNVVGALSMDNFASISAISNPKVEVFPNPTAQRFTVEFQLTEPDQLIFELYNMQGQKVETLMSSYQRTGYKQFSINVDALAKGQYILKVSGANQKIYVNQKVMVN
ncbi:MAG: T9SS type A sorting domain-containing protein [Bacteroidetes bacterium]|nr:T9SS type A sorting domain-containing protein [Bacteroidota bacterium]